MQPALLAPPVVSRLDDRSEEFVSNREAMIDSLAEIDALLEQAEAGGGPEAHARLAKRGGVIESGYELEMSAEQGAVYYTLDGSDPRLVGGGVSPVAGKYSRPVRISKTSVVKVRVLFEEEWSAIDALPFAVKDKKVATNLKK